MDKFTKLTGVAAPMPVVNIDTDMIIPKDYLKTIKRTGLGKGLFAESRYLTTAHRTRISCSTSLLTRTRKFSWLVIISAAAHLASMRHGHCWISASVA